MSYQHKRANGTNNNPEKKDDKRINHKIDQPF
jgi:hypothetical protein